MTQTENTWEFFERLGRESERLITNAQRIVREGSWDDLTTFFETETNELIAQYEQVIPHLKEVHEQILEDQRRAEAERIEREQAAIRAAEERKRQAEEYESAIAMFEQAFQVFSAKISWASTNEARKLGEIVEESPLFRTDKRSGAIATALSVLRSKREYLSAVREAARELLAEQAQVEGQQ
jgi:hypothetical protein